MILGRDRRTAAPALPREGARYPREGARQLAAFTVIVAAGCNFGLPDYADPPRDAGAGLQPATGPVDAATLKCPPVPADGFQLPTWRPPNPIHRAACSQEQANQVADCLAEMDLNPNACDPFRAVPVNDVCYQCAVTSSLATTYGAFIDDGAGLGMQPNVAGCIAAMTNDTSSAGCGARWETLEACGEWACRNCAPTGADFMDFYACTAAATLPDTQCGRSYAAACADPYIDKCQLNDPSYKVSVLKLVRVFCTP